MILLVEDDRKLGEMLSAFLTQNGLDVRWLRDGGDVASFLQVHRPSLAILDWMLPNVTGIELCESIKSQYAFPVMLLTARQAAGDELSGLKVGADDYVRKPFDPDILLARVHNLLNRQAAGHKPQEDTIVLADLSLQLSAKRALYKQATLKITAAEFDLLWLLASNEAHVVSRDQVYRELRGVDYDGVDRLADVQMWRLRKKLEKQGVTSIEIRSIRGQGYVLDQVCKRGV